MLAKSWATQQLETSFPVNYTISRFTVWSNIKQQMAQWIKYLSCKCEVWSLDHQHPIKAETVANTCSSKHAYRKMENGDRRILQTLRDKKILPQIHWKVRIDTLDCPLTSTWHVWSITHTHTTHSNNLKVKLVKPTHILYVLIYMCNLRVILKAVENTIWSSTSEGHKGVIWWE